MYLTEDDFSELGGSPDSLASYDIYEFDARSKIDYYTFGRLKNEKYDDLPEAVKFCMLKLIESATLQNTLLSSIPTMADNENVGIASQSNDGVSIHYNTLSASETYRNSRTDDQNIIRRYLSGVINSLGQELLYRGVYPNER